jgi:cytochrome c biogenesis protein CcmG, thiol:disulfide interchange protein DsbE
LKQITGRIGRSDKLRAMRAPFHTLVACALALGLTACGSSAPAGKVPTPTQARRALAGAPAPLAALHRQAGELLGGGQRAFDARLAALKGHAAVVNAWASWCGPCKVEFPFFQRVSVGYGKRVAFLGVNVNDTPGNARGFLREHWVAYPSYGDHDQHIAHAIGVRAGLPTTVFYDRRGKVAYVHQGQYRDEAQLREDIQRYALGS